MVQFLQPTTAKKFFVTTVKMESSFKFNENDSQPRVNKTPSSSKLNLVVLLYR